MATTSFTKNFSLQKSKSEKFVNLMASDTSLTLPKEFNSRYEHPKHYKEAMREVFGK